VSAYKHQGHVSLVVGATGSIGAIITQHMADSDAIVYATALHNCQKLNDLHEQKPAVRPLCPFNMGAADHRQAALDRIDQDQGHLDSLILAVGAFSQVTPEQTDGDELFHLYHSNVIMPYQLILEAKSLLVASRAPRVVLFGYHDMEHFGPRRLVAGYAAAKASLLIMIRSLAVTWSREHNISMVMVAPGLISGEPETGGDSVPVTRREDIIQAIDTVLSAKGMLLSGQVLPAWKAHRNA